MSGDRAYSAAFYRANRAAVLVTKRLGCTLATAQAILRRQRSGVPLTRQFIKWRERQIEKVRRKSIRRMKRISKTDRKRYSVNDYQKNREVILLAKHMGVGREEARRIIQAEDAANAARAARPRPVATADGATARGVAGSAARDHTPTGHEQGRTHVG